MKNQEKQEPEQEAKEKKKPRRKQGTGTFFRQGKIWYLKYVVNGSPKVVTLRTGDRDEAEKLSKKYLKPLTATTLEEIAVHVSQARKLSTASAMPIEDVWKTYKSSKTRPDSADGTLENYKRNWGKFSKWLKANHPLIEQMNEITKEISEAYAWHLWNSKPKRTANSYNYHIQSLGLITGTLQKAGRVEVNHWKSIDRKKGDKAKRDAFTFEDLKKIFAWFDDPAKMLMHKDEMRLLCHIGAYTGLRLADAVNIKWSQIDFARKRIYATPIKTRGIQRNVTIPLLPALKSHLDRAESLQEGNEYVLPKVLERYNRNPDGVIQDFIYVLDKVGLTGTSHRDRGRARRLYGYHSFRHYYATECADNQVPVAVLKEILGDNIATLQRYYMHGKKDEHNKRIENALDFSATKALPAGVSSEEKLQQINALLTGSTELEKKIQTIIKG